MYKQVVYPTLACFDAETVHERTLSLLQRLGRSTLSRSTIAKACKTVDPRLRVRVFGLDFANPLGLAAGFDKRGVALPIMVSLGFSHGEIGTVTPKPQEGRPRPRIFRLVEDQALINRMGFPGPGLSAAKENLKNLYVDDFVVGLNIGANQTSVNAGKAVDDYVQVLVALGTYADYITINISSPNTAKLRDLQGKQALAALIEQVIGAREIIPGSKPILVKIAPDLTESELDDILDVLLNRDVQGIIATNTTVARPAQLRSANRVEIGGLSGRPLTYKSTEIVRYLYQHTEGKLPIIGVGGVFNWGDALEKILNGASLVQTYTGFIYEGPLLPHRILKGLQKFVDREGVKSIQDLVGARVN